MNKLKTWSQNTSSKIEKYMRETVGLTDTEINLVLKALDREGEAYYPTATHYVYIREE